MPVKARMIARTALAFTLVGLLAACASQARGVVEHAATTPGFLLGLWHGFVFPFAWVGSLFRPGVAVYAVPNNGGWYNFGLFLGITVLGGGSHFTARQARRSN